MRRRRGAEAEQEQYNEAWYSRKKWQRRNGRNSISNSNKNCWFCTDRVILCVESRRGGRVVIVHRSYLNNRTIITWSPAARSGSSSNSKTKRHARTKWLGEGMTPSRAYLFMATTKRTKTPTSRRRPILLTIPLPTTLSRPVLSSTRSRNKKQTTTTTTSRLPPPQQQHPAASSSSIKVARTQEKMKEDAITEPPATE